MVWPAGLHHRGHAVMSYSVTPRGQEPGIRMALGARPGDVLFLMLKQAAGATIRAAKQIVVTARQTQAGDPFRFSLGVGVSAAAGHSAAADQVQASAGL